MEMNFQISFYFLFNKIQRKIQYNTFHKTEYFVYKESVKISQRCKR